MSVQVGPDAWRLLHLGTGGKVVAPFHLRWLLPTLCRNDMRRWWGVWLASWPILAGGMVAFGLASDLGVQRSIVAALLVLGLPGVLGPRVTIPVGVDLPALALGSWAAAAMVHGWWPVALVLVALASTVRETSGVWVGLWSWHPAPLAVGLVVVVLRHAITDRRGLDPLTESQPVLRRVHEHPIRSSLEHHAGRWRDAWVMVAPWGVCLAALVDPSWQLGVVLLIAYGQLLVATDTVRLYQSAVAPVMALGAAAWLPAPWLWLAVVLHVMWWRKPERI
jgi:hypothetical protein